MHLYHGPASHFVRDSLQNAVAEKLDAAFQAHFRHRPSPGEIASWRNSLRAMGLVLREADLLNTNVILEYQLPLTSCRLDCMILGRDARQRASATVVELKQWEEVELSEVEGCVETWLGGARREVAHPSAQVGQYRQYLADMHEAFRGSAAIDLSACSYLHNATAGETASLRDPRYAAYLERAPIYCGDESIDLVAHLHERAQAGDDGELLKRVIEAPLRPSKALMAHVAEVIRNEPVYTLLDEQFVTFHSILHNVRKAFHQRSKGVVIVHGGPGTGKSVIATNLVGELSRLHYSVFHATGSKAFTQNLKRYVGPRASKLFGYFNNFTTTAPGELDVLICDEAHRIRNTSNTRYTKKDKRSEISQITELLRAARVAVFFIDDLQIVRPGEVGSSALIREAAAEAGSSIKEFELEAQFRCAGSDAFVNWIDNTLGVRRTPNVLWNAEQESFDFRIVDSVQELDALIRARSDAGSSARLVAGYCWPWSNEATRDRRLAMDVRIGNWERAWNARNEFTRLAPGIPKSNFWATDPGGIEQVGCVYTAQGFEFDYVGLIWGPDLLYRHAQGDWVGDPSASHDGVVKRAKHSFLQNVKHVYRVLLSRGMRGCYVCFLDRETREFVESRIEGAQPLAGIGRQPPNAGPAPGRPQRGARSKVAAEPKPSEFGSLSRLGVEVVAALRAAPELASLAEDRDLVGDLVAVLEREDYAGWERDPVARGRIHHSIQRLLGSMIPGAGDIAGASRLLLQRIEQRLT